MNILSFAILLLKIERLIRFLNELGQDVSIMISPAQTTERGSTWIGESHSNTRIAALGR